MGLVANPGREARGGNRHMERRRDITQIPRDKPGALRPLSGREARSNAGGRLPRVTEMSKP
jgi:hypothetical protein